MPEILETIGPRSGTAPLVYRLAELGTVELQSAFAHFDGTAASGSWRPALTVKAQDGSILSRTFPSDTLAAGDTADVTYSPFVPAASTSTPTGGGDINVIAEGLGLLAWTIDPQTSTNQIRPSTRTLLGTVWLPAGTVVTSLSFYINAPEVTPSTSVYIMMYDAAFSLVGVTANTPSLDTAAGWRTAALTSPYTVAADGLFYLGSLHDPVTNSPTLVGGFTNTATQVALPGGKFRAPQQAGTATPPNPFVPTSSSQIMPLLAALP